MAGSIGGEVIAVVDVLFLYWVIIRPRLPCDRVLLDTE